MKKIVCLGMIFVLFLCALPAFASTDSSEDLFHPELLLDPLASSCKHDYQRMSSSPSSVRWVSISKSLHEKRTYYPAVCNKCGSTIQVYDTSDIGPHIWNPNGNKHVGKGKHEYYFNCSLCNEKDTVNYPCSGTGNGDCPYPFALTPPAP